jgi:hypothetical protein
MKMNDVMAMERSMEGLDQVYKALLVPEVGS